MDIHAARSKTISYFNGLIKQKRNYELRSILFEESPMNLINKRESTLVHAAVVFNNVQIIAVLFSFGYDINAKNTLGQTPLLLAAHNNSYQAIQLLLSLDAEVFVDDFRGENAFQVLLSKQKNTPAYVIGCLSERLKRSNISPDKIVEELMKAECPLEHVLKLNNAVVMREMLKRTNKIDKATSCALLERAMHSEDINNVYVLLHYGPDERSRRERFIERVTNYIFHPVTRPYFEQIFNWKLVEDRSFFRVEEYLTHGNEKAVRLLLDMGIEKYCMEKFGYSAIVSLFHNRNIDLAQVLRNTQFDVANSRDCESNSALHVAIMEQNKSAIVYLLENGADPNIKDDKGRTPLFYAKGNEKIAEILLDAGADLQVIDVNDETLITNDFAVANLMIVKARGEPINDELNELMFGPDTCDTKLQDNCELHSLQLEWMKTRWVSESINLFFVLTETFERLAPHMKNEKTCEEIVKATRERSLKQTYANMLSKNLEKARKMNELKVKAAEFLCDQMQIASDDHLVIRMVVGFLTFDDLLVFDRLEDDNDESLDEAESEAKNEAEDDYIWWKRQEMIEQHNLHIPFRHRW